MALPSIHKQIHVNLISVNAPEQNTTNIKLQVFQALNWNQTEHNAAQLVNRLQYNHNCNTAGASDGPTLNCFIQLIYTDCGYKLPVKELLYHGPVGWS